MNNMEHTINFGIEGESITEIIHSMILSQRRLGDIFNLLKQSLDGANDKVIWDLILGRADLKGRSSDNTLAVTYLEEENVSNCLFEMYDRILDEYNLLLDILNNIASYKTEMVFEQLSELQNNKLRVTLMDLLDRLGMIRDYTPKMNRVLIHKVDTEECGREGWLRPNGKFISVEFGLHRDWAVHEVDKIGERDHFNEWHKDNQSSLEEDFLIEQKGYVLLHDPAVSGRVGIYARTKLGRQIYTIEQREFIEKFKSEYATYEG